MDVCRYLQCVNALYLKVDDLSIRFRNGLCVERCRPQQHLVGTDTQSPPVTFRTITSTSLYCP